MVSNANIETIPPKRTTLSSPISGPNNEVLLYYNYYNDERNMTTILYRYGYGIF